MSQETTVRPLAALPPLPTLFADGGVLGSNPSPVAGTYAYCLIDPTGAFVKGNSGLVISRVAGDTSLCGDAYPAIDGPVTNNITEFYAILAGLESLPDGWSGRVCSDSRITLGRFWWSYAMRGIPREWIARGGAALKRLGAIEPVLLQGHPTREDLARGIGAKRGLPVSHWNAWCDRTCNERAAEYVKVAQMRQLQAVPA